MTEVAEEGFFPIYGWLTPSILRLAPKKAS